MAQISGTSWCEKTQSAQHTVLIKEYIETNCYSSDIELPIKTSIVRALGSCLCGSSPYTGCSKNCALFLKFTTGHWIAPMVYIDV